MKSMIAMPGCVAHVCQNILELGRELSWRSAGVEYTNPESSSQHHHLDMVVHAYNFNTWVLKTTRSDLNFQAFNELRDQHGLRETAPNTKQPRQSLDKEL